MDQDNTTPNQEGSSSNPSGISTFWQEKYRKESSKNWNLFYKRNQTKFFKDRHWISREFPELYSPNTKSILEVGCGVGNFALPLSEDNPNLSIFACDFAPSAIEHFKKDERYSTGRLCAFVTDITSDDLANNIQPSSIDIITLVFVLSAIPPEKFKMAISNLRRVLRPNGLILFRDYAANDAAQLRFKDDRKLSESLYVRQDGTLAYYFQKDELIDLFAKEGFTIESCDFVHSKTTNVKKQIDVDRLFLQAKFKLSKN